MSYVVQIEQQSGVIELSQKDYYVDDPLDCICAVVDWDMDDISVLIARSHRPTKDYGFSSCVNKEIERWFKIRCKEKSWSGETIRTFKKGTKWGKIQRQYFKDTKELRLYLCKLIQNNVLVKFHCETEDYTSHFSIWNNLVLAEERFQRMRRVI